MFNNNITYKYNMLTYYNYDNDSKNKDDKKNCIWSYFILFCTKLVQQVHIYNNKQII